MRLSRLGPFIKGGTIVQQNCVHCGVGVERGAARCSSCGHTQGPSGFELRQGTFLFCDLVGSTRLINALEPDAQLDVMQGVRVAVLDVLARLGGRNERFDGDGYFVSFVGPDSHEGDAVVAIRVGLEITRAIEAAGNGLGRDLRMRVGIASGSVLVGYREDTTAVPDEGYIGAAINLAKRLVGVAPVGAVVVADATRRQAGRFFDYEELPKPALRDFDESLKAWRIVGTSPVGSRFLATREPVDGRALFGRSREMEELRGAWSRCLKGNRVTVELRGEPGIGKSSLAYWLGDEAAQAGATVLDLDCTPRTRHTPFFPIAVMLRRLAGVADRVEPSGAIVRVQTWIATQWGDARALALKPFLPVLLMQAVDDSARSEQVAARAVVAVVNWIKAWAAACPVLVRAEDVHWADAATMDLIQALAAVDEPLPLMVLTTSRESASVLGTPDSVAIDLSPLDDASASQIVRRIIGASDADAATVDRVVKVADGMPLYLEEMARAAVGPEGLNLVFREGTPLPATLAMLVQSRIDRLPALRPVVQAAAILGRDFSVALLRRLLDDPPGLPEAVTRIVDEGLWERRRVGAEGTWLRFKHALIHEAAYQSRLASERRSLHSRVADILQTAFADHPTVTQDIVGHHLAAAHRFGEAAACYLQAATTAASRGAYRDAAAHCRNGISLAQRQTASAVNRHLLRQLHAQLGVAAAATSGYAAEEVESTYNSARSLCDDQDDPAALFPIVRGLGFFNFVRGRFAEAHRIALECVELAELSDRMDHKIEAASFLGYTELYRGHLGAAREALKHCIDLYRSEGGERFQYPSPQDAGTSALALLGTVAWLQGDVQAAETAAADALEHARRLARPIDDAYVRAWLSMLRNLQRRFDHARELADECITISQEHGFSTWWAAATMQRCIAVSSAASSPDAVGMLRYVLGEFKRAGAEANAPYFEWGIARGALCSGDTAVADEALARARVESDRSGETYLRAELLILEGELAADVADARRLFTQAFNLSAEQGACMLALRAASAWLVRSGLDPAGSPLLEQALAVLAHGGAESAPADGWAIGAMEQARTWVN